MYQLLRIMTALESAEDCAMELFGQLNQPDSVIVQRVIRVQTTLTVTIS